MTNPWLTIVGLGEDGLEGVSRPARSLVAGAEILIGGERHLAMVPDGAAERHSWPTPLRLLLERFEGWRGRRVVVLATGDPYCWGIGNSLARIVPPEETAVFPAPSAFAYACARLGWARHEVESLTLHGRPLALLAARLYPGARILALSHDGTTPAKVAKALCDRGLADSRLVVLEHLGGPKEGRIEKRAGDWSGGEVADLNTLAIEVQGDADAARTMVVPGLPDEVFSHDGKLTKRVVRAATLAALAPVPGQALWDVGAGSGAIAIEWLRATRWGRAWAIEKAADQRARIAVNAEALGTPQLEIVDEAAPRGLHDLPQPDAIFIGGGLGAPRLVDLCADRLGPGGRLVANAVTIESEIVLMEAHRRLGGELTRIAVSTAAPVGRMTGWRPAMPVTQWAWIKP